MFWTVGCYALGMVTGRARVRNGRLILDEPTELPEGTEVDLISLDDPVLAAILAAPIDGRTLTDEERSRIEKYRLGRSRFIPAEDVRTKLDARK